MERRQGRIVAVCSRGTSGIPKTPRPEVQLGPLGVVGDYHAGPVDRHFRRGKPRPNRRHVTVVAAETLAAVDTEIGLALEPGDLGENILVRGLGDLSDLAPGDRLTLGETAAIEVTAQNRPCPTLRALGPGIERALKGRRGITAVVLTPGRLRPGDPVHVHRAPPRDEAEDG